MDENEKQAILDICKLLNIDTEQYTALGQLNKIHLRIKDIEQSLKSYKDIAKFAADMEMGKIEYTKENAFWVVRLLYIEMKG